MARVLFLRRCSKSPEKFANLCRCGKGSVQVSQIYAVVARVLFKLAEPLPL